MARWFALPLVIGAAAILAPAALTLYSQVSMFMGAPLAWPAPLYGVGQPAEPDLSAAALWDGSYQAQIAKTFGALSPLYPDAVRLKNEMLFRLFHTTGVPNLMVGRKGVLMELNYTGEACSRVPATMHRYEVSWLRYLLRMQAMVEGQGKIFLYVITPSKPALLPQDLPRSMNCPATAAMRAEADAAWRAMLTQAGIHFVDTTAIMAQAVPHFPFPLFPRGGTHWNGVGAALGAQAVAGALNARSADRPFGALTFTWTVTRDPRGQDSDLAQLMNLFWPRLDYPVPAVALQYAPPVSPCRPVHVTIIGDSFMHQIADDLARGPCHPAFELWDYWQGLHMAWPQEDGGPSPTDPAQRKASLLESGVIIYAENESNAARAEYGVLFTAYLQQQLGWDRQAPSQP